MAQQWMLALSRWTMVGALLVSVGCAGVGLGKKGNGAPFRPLGEADYQPFTQPFPNFQSSNQPIDLPVPGKSESNIALTDFQTDGDVIELPIPADDVYVDSESITGPASMSVPLVMGESCADGNCGGCANGGCANDQCSTDGLNLRSGPYCAPKPPQYTHSTKHAALSAERSNMKAMGIKPEKRRFWFTSWKKDPTPDIAFNNPCFPRELRMKSHPQYVVEPPDVLYIEVLTILPNRPLLGERLIRQDGTISLGYYGQVHVAGLTLLEVENKIREHLKMYVDNPQVYVDVASFNSKVYYVLGQVQQQGRLPITGKETVLDAITLAGGLTNYADFSKIHIARPNPGGGCDQVLWVDWKALAFCGDTRTNYQILPGDRVVVPGTTGFGTSRLMDNYFAPIERAASIFGLFRFALSNN